MIVINNYIIAIFCWFMLCLGSSTGFPQQKAGEAMINMNQDNLMNYAEAQPRFLNGVPPDYGIKFKKITLVHFVLYHYLCVKMGQLESLTCVFVVLCRCDGYA